MQIETLIGSTKILAPLIIKEMHKQFLPDFTTGLNFEEQVVYFEEFLDNPIVKARFKFTFNQGQATLAQRVCASQMGYPVAIEQLLGPYILLSNWQSMLINNPLKRTNIKGCLDFLSNVHPADPSTVKRKLDSLCRTNGGLVKVAMGKNRYFVGTARYRLDFAACLFVSWLLRVHSAATKELAAPASSQYYWTTILGFPIEIYKKAEAFYLT
jgi:hypothetical protein